MTIECPCPTNTAGDVRCHFCGEYVNKRCWRCGGERGAGACPTMLSRSQEPKDAGGFTVPQRKDLLWLAIDLDGTLAESLWTPENPTTAIGAPIKRNVVKLREAVRKGYKPVIHTSRPWTDYEAIEAWLLANEIPFRGIVCGKLLAALYVDDRARHAEDSSWLP